MWYIIINPAAANKKAKKKWIQLEKILKSNGINFKTVWTERQNHATELAQEGIKAGFKKIIAVGGDGTSNEVINGIMMQNIVPSSEIKYTLLPIGTGNDWVKTHKIPKKIKAWIAMLKAEKIAFQDVGLVEYHQDGVCKTRYFPNVAGMAYDGFIGKVLSTRQGIASNKLRYLYLTLVCLFKYRLTRARVTFDDQVIDNYFYLINAGICKYSGGGMSLVPHAVPDDGKLAITLAGNLSKFNVIKSMPLLYNGKLAKHPQVDTYYTKKIKIEALNDDPTLLEVDGEFLGETPVEISIVEKALQLIVP